MKELLFNKVGYDGLKRSEYYFDEEHGVYQKTDQKRLLDAGKCFERAQAFCHQFLKASEVVRENFLLMGKTLFMIKTDELYHFVSAGDGAYGYRSFYKFVQDVFGMGKTTAAGLIAVYERFGVGNEVSLYQGYSYSQLLEMKDMKDGVQKLNAGVSVRKIKLLKKFYNDHGVDYNTTLEEDLSEALEDKKQQNAMDSVRRANMEFIPGDDTPGALKEYEVEGYAEEEPNDVLTEETVQTSERFDEDNSKSEKALSAVDPEFVLKVSRGMIRRKFNDIAFFKPGIKPFADMVLGALEDGSCYQELSVKTIRSKALGQTDKFHIELKNDKARREWIEDYRKWGIWIDIPEIGVTLYRYEFFNGDTLIVTSYYTYWSFAADDRRRAEEKYCILTQDKPHYDFLGMSKTLVLDYLSKNRDTI